MFIESRSTLLGLIDIFRNFIIRVCYILRMYIMGYKSCLLIISEFPKGK